MERPVISYDDITLPYEAPPPAESSNKSKKRKRANQKQNGNNKKPQEEDEEDTGGRLLTSEEIWDDSALIDAWNAATEEYEALNGPDKGWKSEPVHKSPLWYNVPPTKPPKKKVKTMEEEVEAPAAEGDSKPLDFDTFVPTHDASLPEPEAPPELEIDFSAPQAFTATRDEAFTRALGAMYWVGYWTAVHHARGQDGEEEEEQGDEQTDDFVPSQR